MKVRVFSNFMLFLCGLCFGVSIGVYAQRTCEPWIALTIGIVSTAVQTWLAMEFAKWLERRAWQTRMAKLDATMHAFIEKFGPALGEQAGGVCPVCNQAHEPVNGIPEGEKH